jgi:tricorn protease
MIRVRSLILLAVVSMAPSLLHADEAIHLISGHTLSPDGATLAFAWQGDIWTVSSQGGVAQRLTSDEATDAQPAYSPDGKHLAFISDRDGSRQVYLMPADGGEVTRLTFHTEGYALLEWYPDGQSLLTSASRDHFWRHSERFFQIKKEPRTGEKLLFDAYGESGTISPDGKRMLFTREGVAWWRKGYRGSQSSQIWLYDFGSGQFSEVARHETGCRSPLWDPSGERFYYVSGQSGSFNLWARDLDSDNEKQLTDFQDDSVVLPCISRDGTTIVFRHLFDLYRLNPAKNEPPQKIDIHYGGDEARDPMMRRTLKAATDVAFSSDGLEIAFIAGGDVWVMDTELREPQQVTDTAEEERSITFAPDNKTLLFVSDAGQQCDIWSATREDDEAYWWQNETFSLKKLTDDTIVEDNLSWSPTGDLVAFTKQRGDLWVMKPDGSEARCILSSWNAPQFDWSPDGKWMVYAISDNDFNRDIHIMPLDGSREPFNLSLHPDNDYDPVWSPDGSMIAFTGRRIGDEVDIYYVYLQADKDEETSRDRKLKKAIEKIQKVRKKKPAAAKPEPKAADKPKEDDKTDKEGDEKSDKGKTDEEAKPDAKEQPQKPEVKPVEIDFEGIHERIKRLSVPDSSESGLFWSHDSKMLAFVASIDGKRGTYTISPPEELKPKLLTTTTGSNARWIKQGNQILWLVSGVPASYASGKSNSFSFNVQQAVDVGTRYQTAFMQCWRTMRDNFYDGRLNNRNWDAVYRKYAPMAQKAIDASMLADLVNMMLGELNGSHLGFFGRSGRSGSSASSQWRETTVHLGLRFDPTHKGPGLKVRDVILDGPADKEKSKIVAGEIVLSIDGTDVDPGMDLTTVLNGRLDRDVHLRIQDADGEERKVSLRPTSYSSARSALYEMWIRHNRELVEKDSDGKFGYLHIRGMNMSSFYRFEKELYEVAAGKDAIVIDVRENGGGSTTDHLLTILTQPDHAITIPRGGGRGYPHDRRVYATWNKPIIVLCNQNSFSNAEIFSHAIKTLKRGKVVGVTTAGCVISTGGTSIMDMGFLRLPFRAWFLLDSGEDMELRGAEPHVEIWPAPGEWPAGKDRQLAKALAMLKKDVKKFQKRPQPKLRYSSERDYGG